MRDSESLREARLADDVERVTVARENESELESEAKLAAVRTEDESESLYQARLAADVDRVFVAA